MAEPTNFSSSVPVQSGKRGSPRRRSLLIGFGYFGIFLLMQIAVAGPVVLFLSIGKILALGVMDLNSILDAVAQAALENAALITACCDGAALITAYFILRSKKRPFFPACGFKKIQLRRLLPLIPFGIALNFAISFLLALLPQEFLSSYNQSAESVIGAENVLSILIVAGFAPFAEETFFRGLIYTNFRQGLPRGFAVFLQALLFGVMHGNPIWIAYAFVLGIVLALLRDRYQTLFAPMLAHISFNAANYLLLALANLSGGAILLTAFLLLAAAILGMRAENKKFLP